MSSNASSRYLQNVYNKSSSPQKQPNNIKVQKSILSLKSDKKWNTVVKKLEDSKTNNSNRNSNRKKKKKRNSNQSNLKGGSEESIISENK